MNLAWLIPTVLIVVAGVLVVVALWLDSRDSDAVELAGWTAVLLAATALIWFLSSGILTFSAYQDGVSCERFGEASGREVKLERYRFTDWDCLVLTDDGWIARENLYVDEGGRP